MKYAMIWLSFWRDLKEEFEKKRAIWRNFVKPSWIAECVKVMDSLKVGDRVDNLFIYVACLEHNLHMMCVGFRFLLWFAKGKWKVSGGVVVGYVVVDIISWDNMAVVIIACSKEIMRR